MMDALEVDRSSAADPLPEKPSALEQLLADLPPEEEKRNRRTRQILSALPGGERFAYAFPCKQIFCARIQGIREAVYRQRKCYD